MYLLVDLNKVSVIDMVVLPEIWSIPVTIEGYNPEVVLVIYMFKQSAYIAKHVNKLGDNWVVIPLENFLRLKNSVDDFMIQQFNSIRFGFCIGYSNDLENTKFHIKMVRFDDLISGHDWVKQISDKNDSLKLMIKYDKTCGHKQAEQLAIKMVQDLGVNNESSK